ncbi:MAG: hypothetical protein JWQ99_268 [Blastococcus sp.]|jgi:hypothetical protein|nr:hypothetical protein [Blastococcus sp.]
MGDRRDHPQQPEEHHRVHGQRQHDADDPGQHPVAGLVRESEHSQDPRRPLGHPSGQSEAAQAHGAEQQERQQVLDVVAKDVGLVDVALPDPLHPDPELVHRAEARVEEADQADDADDPGRVDRAGQLVDEAPSQRAGEGIADRGEQLVLQQRVPAQDQADHRGDQQQHREQAQEREVGDARGDQVALGALVAAARPGEVVEPRTTTALRGDQPLDRRVPADVERLAAVGTHRPSLRYGPGVSGADR